MATLFPVDDSEYADPLTAPIPKTITSITDINERLNLIRATKPIVTESKTRGRPKKEILTTTPEQSQPVMFEERVKTGFVTPFKNDPDTWGKWKKIVVGESSPILAKWILDCQKIVDDHFGENVWKILPKKASKYHWFVMKNLKTNQERTFAFILKGTGDIHTPALYDDPFEHCVGNIADNETRISCMSPYGVKAFFTWLPTHPNYVKHHR